MWKNKHLPYIYSSLYSSLYLFIQNTYIYSSSRFNFNHTTIISISFCIRVPNFVQIQQPVADLVGFSGAILLLVSDWVMSSFQKVKVYRQTKLCWDNSIHSWDITISGSEKNWVGGIPTKDSDGRRNPGSKTRDRQTLVNRFHPIFRWWATSMMQSCMPNFKMKFSGLRFYRGVKLSVFLRLFARCLQQCNASALPVMNHSVLLFSVGATEAWRELHWLPIRQHITFKLATMTYKARQSGQPAYLSDSIHD